MDKQTAASREMVQIIKAKMAKQIIMNHVKGSWQPELDKVTADKLTEAILKELQNGTWKLENGEIIQGEAFSSLLSSLRYDGWQNLQTVSHDFETTLEQLGFRIVYARSVGRNQLARVVTV